jgi:hypothetical protein
MSRPRQNTVKPNNEATAGRRVVLMEGVKIHSAAQEISKLYGTKSLISSKYRTSFSIRRIHTISSCACALNINFNVILPPSTGSHKSSLLVNLPLYILCSFLLSLSVFCLCHKTLCCRRLSDVITKLRN